MHHLIANSGVQFITPEPIELDFSSQYLFPNGKTLKYSFLEIKDFITEELTFDLAIYNAGIQSYIPLKELIDNRALVYAPNGREKLDGSGMPQMDPQSSPTLFSSYKSGSPEVININSLESFRIKNGDNNEAEPAWTRLIGKWLPMPMFEKDIDGVTTYGPIGWCRVKIIDEGQGSKKDLRRYRFVWAFDTKTTDDMLSFLRPNFVDGNGESKEYCLCNNVQQLLPFMSTSSEFSAFSDYIRSLFGLDPRDLNHKYIGYYIYFINYIRLCCPTPEPTLYYCEDSEKYIDVDLVLDIGNSKTCGILFERGMFIARDILELRDMTQPWLSYSKSFDMRLVFRLADFGNEILLEEKMFNWPSFVRVGDEARNLVYNAREDNGVAGFTTNYSSPKRYLWDNKPFNGQWEFLCLMNDPQTVQRTKNIYISQLSDMFDSKGNYYPEGVSVPMEDMLNSSQYSRSSLMTFVLIEIFQQAMSQINSMKYRNIRGEINRKRILRHIILTCPTAMPNAEQLKLRKCAEDAYDAISRCIPISRRAIIVPSTQSLAVADDDNSPIKREWSFDEASCCQLVYLYAEVAQRYSGEIRRFINFKGHVRPEDADEGNPVPSLTVCSIDIGAGTTDIIINNYRYDAKGHNNITPMPVFWDSYYVAGDDILRRVIQNQILEGKMTNSPDFGSITSALVNRLLKMTNEQIAQLPCMNHPIQGVAHRSRRDSITMSANNEDREYYIKNLAVDLMHDYFGNNNEGMTIKDRHCRVDFITQIAHPMAQFFLELLRTHHPSRVFSYKELLEDQRCFNNAHPSEFLLDHFEKHFGFRFEELNWRYDPDSIANDIRSTMEPLMKTLSEVVYAHHCDILVLAGRPTSLDPITELFIKYIPISPHRLIRLNSYHVGEWYPFTYGNGLIYDQKTIVAVGGMIGYLASHSDAGFSATTGGAINQQQIVLNFDKMIKNMKSTALYMAELNTRSMQLKAPIFLTPKSGTANVMLEGAKPVYIGCSQFNTTSYQSRPIYSLKVVDPTVQLPITVSITRNFFENRELLTIESVTDKEGNEIGQNSVCLTQQSLVDEDGSGYWLDDGRFDLFITNGMDLK